jgi:hypothetical protein
MNKEEKHRFKRRLGIHSDPSIGLEPVTASREKNRTLLAQSGRFEKVQSPKTGMVVLHPVSKEPKGQRSRAKVNASITQELKSVIPNRRKKEIRDRLMTKSDVIKALSSFDWDIVSKGNKQNKESKRKWEIGQGRPVFRAMTSRPKDEPAKTEHISKYDPYWRRHGVASSEASTWGSDQTKQGQNKNSGQASLVSLARQSKKNN